MKSWFGADMQDSEPCPSHKCHLHLCSQMQPDAANNYHMCWNDGLTYLVILESWNQNMSTEHCRWDMPENTSQQDSKTATRNNEFKVQVSFWTRFPQISSDFIRFHRFPICFYAAIDHGRNGTTCPLGPGPGHRPSNLAIYGDSSPQNLWCRL